MRARVRQPAHSCWVSSPPTPGQAPNEHVLSHADVIQVGNEPDGDRLNELNQPSGSMIMTPDDYVAMFNRIRARHPDRTLIAAGMTTNQGPMFPVEKVIPRLEGCAGIARHLYWPSKEFYTTPAQTENVLAAFHPADELQGIPLWVTEWHPSPLRPELVPFIPEYAAVLRRVAVRDFFLLLVRRADGEPRPVPRRRRDAQRGVVTVPANALRGFRSRGRARIIARGRPYAARESTASGCRCRASVASRTLRSRATAASMCST
jgi:hypothetical protein